MESHTDIVAGIWLMNKDKASKIHQEFKEYSIFILVSQSGLWYAEKIYADDFSNDDRAYIKDMLGANFGLFLKIETDLDEGYWSVCQKALVNGQLGEPDFGYNPLYKVEQKSNLDCVCDIITVMNTGCPSAHGLPCPSRK